MNKYPEYVSRNRPKGTVVKKVNNTYYVYECRSKRVKDRPYPVQVIGECIGKIDYAGFHENEYLRIPRNAETVIREYGFSNYLLTFLDEYVAQNAGRSRKDSTAIFKNMITHLSINSCLCDDDSFIHYSREELAERFGIGFPNQVTAVLKMAGRTLEELEGLKTICLVRIGKHTFYSGLTAGQEGLLKKLGVEHDDIR